MYVVCCMLTQLSPIFDVLIGELEQSWGSQGQEVRVLIYDRCRTDLNRLGTGYRGVSFFCLS